MLALELAAGGDFIDQPRAVQHQCETALHPGLLLQQHAAHIGMADDRHGRARILATRTGQPTLRPLARIGRRSPVARVAEHCGAEPDADARLVHHREHDRQTTAKVADPIADGAGRAFRPVRAFAEVQHGVDGAAVAELVIEPRKGDVVALAAAAIGIHQPARHDEE